MNIICDERQEQLDEREICPRCGERGFYAAISIFWGFRCDHCGYKDGNTEQARRNLKASGHWDK